LADIFDVRAADLQKDACEQLVYLVLLYGSIEALHIKQITFALFLGGLYQLGASWPRGFNNFIW
jgi:hypothetical protein